MFPSKLRIKRHSFFSRSFCSKVVGELKGEEIGEESVEYDEFKKMDFRIARVISAEEIKGSEKLVKVTLSLGKEGERQVLSGIKKHFEPSKLVGRNLLYLSNLKEKKIGKFGVSKGMILCSLSDEGRVCLVESEESDEGAKVL